jgi:hypothetical protein
MKETKDLFNESYQSPKRETEEDNRRWKISHACGLAEPTL